VTYFSLKVGDGILHLYKATGETVLYNLIFKVFESRLDVNSCPGCSLSPYLFNIFIDDDVIENVNEVSTHAPVIGDVTIPGVLYADNLATGVFKVNGLQKATDQIAKYCEEWSINVI
jgi:hypothetical protein